MVIDKDQIFNIHNLTDFEKVLFLEKQVVELIEIAKNRGELVRVLRARIDQLESLVVDSKSAKRIAHMKREQQALRTKMNKLRSDFNHLTYKYNNHVKSANELETIEFYAVEGSGKGNKFSTAQGEFWLHRDSHVIDSNKNELVAPKWMLDIKLKR